MPGRALGDRHHRACNARRQGSTTRSSWTRSAVACRLVDQLQSHRCLTCNAVGLAIEQRGAKLHHGDSFRPRHAIHRLDVHRPRREIRAAVDAFLVPATTMRIGSTTPPPDQSNDGIATAPSLAAT